MKAARAAFLFLVLILSMSAPLSAESPDFSVTVEGDTSETGKDALTICEECVDNTNGDKVHDKEGNLTHTRDDCVIDANGAICGHKKDGTAMCCDWDKAGTGRKCKCNTEAGGKCKTDEACAACMLIAEAGGEPKGACQQAVVCTFQNRAKALNKSLCEAVLSKSGKTGDGPAFDSSKCICDRVDPAANVGYNQNYCECCEKGSDYQGYENALNAVNSADCSKAPYNKITFFNANGKIPCKNGEVQVGKCGHKFYACPFP